MSSPAQSKAPIPQPPATPQAPAAPGTIPVAQAAPQLVPFEALQAQEAALLEQISIFQAQRRVLVRQLRSSDVGMRTAAPAQLTQVDLQLASAQTSLASVQANIAARQTQRVAGQPFRNVPPPRRDYIPGEAAAAIMIVFTLAVLMPISIGITRRLWRRAPATPKTEDTIAPRLDRLEHAVDAIAIEIERISEGQRFVTRVMTERPSMARPASAPEVNEAAALGEAKPFLALGAGPIEPIAVPQRQAVRQSITPH